MNKIQVDPKLFITCRLCLDSMGVYQIDPSVQEQIKSCFDIDVHPFDRLPQLICTECETLLTNFYGKRKMFQEKQNALRLKLQVDDIAGVDTESKTKVTEHSPANHSPDSEQTQQETVTSSQSSDIIVKERKSKNKSKKRPKDAPSTLVEKEPIQPLKIILQTKRKIKLSITDILECLGPNYVLRYTCTVCNKHFGTKKAIAKHSNEHTRLMSQHVNVFKKLCKVTMEKIDDAPNKTKSIHTVVIENNKIIQNPDTYYYISYHLKQNDLDCNEHEEEVKQKKKHRRIKPLFDDSSEEEFNVSRNKKKRPRLISRSSTDTVVLDDNVKSEPKVSTPEKKKEIAMIECIDIDDSSDESNQCSKMLNQFDCDDKFTAEPSEYKTIQNIISMCHGKYMKKLDSGENSDNKTPKTKSSANFESFLKHKVLSIGRKIINKQSFNCNGLLRFLDHKNLNIDWKSVKVSEENNHIRILTQMRDLSKKNTNYEKIDKWKKVKDNITPTLGLLTQDSTQETEETGSVSKNNKSSNNETNSNTSQTKIHVVPVSTADSAVLYLNADHNRSVNNKLLNENPVPNPKKLPKKLSGFSSVQPSEQITANKTDKDGPVTALIAALMSNELNVNISDSMSNFQTQSGQLTVEAKESENMRLPIIKSTTSLADPGLETGKSSTTPQPETNMNPTPRIKVKPVSELMPNKATGYVGEPASDIRSAVWNVTSMTTCQSNPSNPGSQIPFRVTASTPATTPQHLRFNNTSVSNDSVRDELILNTVEFPNTKTSSPFKYLKNLLQLHSIFLCWKITPVNLLNCFTCLIKYKVHFSDANLSLNPVILSSSLLCYQNQFCIKITDNNRDKRIVDMTAMSAKWQWQLLQTFKGDVGDKILENAGKISREVHYHTNIFLSMLKSIEVVD